MTPVAADPELSQLRASAKQLAEGRKERLTSAHLLAAIAAFPGAASDLLVDHKLGPEPLLKAARSSTEDVDDGVRRALAGAREIAARTGSTEARAEHLLVALLSERRSAAHRALEQMGADVSRLRSRSMNLALGILGRRRIVTRREADASRQADSARREAETPVRSRGTAVPLVPQTPTPIPRTTPALPRVTPAAPAAALPAPKSSPRHSRPSGRMAKRSRNASRFDLDAKRFPTLVSLAVNLSAAAERGEVEPVVGRDLEVEQTLDVLAKRRANNPLLVGAPGVGKTSIVRALARHIVETPNGAAHDDRIVLEVPVAELLAGTGVRGALAERFSALRSEARALDGRAVVFFDDVHLLLGGEASEEISGDLKLALAKGELPCIGATTPEEFARVIEKDPALARRFSVVAIEEPTREDAFLILEALSPDFERHHAVRYTEQALALSVTWSVRYVTGRALPEKAISILDLAGARTRRRGGLEVAAEQVAEVVAEMADLPIERLLESDGDRMLRLEEILAERVVGHEEQIRRIARILRRNAAGLVSRRPIGTFLLLGPTGVGKTETAKAVAEALFTSEHAMTRIDMGEYGEAHATARLIGAPPGYVGFESGGQLTEAVRRRPYQVILLDEIEKAHPEVLETFLAVFDEGRLTDGRGRTVDFTNTVIFLTSNIGASETGAAPRRKVGFGAGAVDPVAVESAVTAAARAALAPELYNRIDEVLVFAALDRDEVRVIAERLLRRTAIALEAERDVRLEFDAAAIEALLDQGGFDPTLGARPMRRTLARLVEAPLAEMILRGDVGAGGLALITATDGVVEVRAGARRAAPAAE